MNEVLRNGAIVLLRRDTGIPFLKVVLCEWRGEFVTWIQNIQEEGDGTSAGNYFKNLEDATLDFSTRK